MTPGDEGISELDVLSPLAATILHDGPPQRYTALVVTGVTPAEATRVLGGITPEALLQKPARDLDDAKAMLAGFWLWFDALDESHRIAQDIASPTGSFWHAIMHRREGDFSNAKYWYGRCGGHRVNRILGAVAPSLVGAHATDPLLQHLASGGWDGGALVDLVQSIYRRPEDPRHAVAVRLQQAEWQAIFNHCALAAAGSPLD